MSSGTALLSDIPAPVRRRSAMARLRPGGIPWLLWHELRLFNRRSDKPKLALALLGFVLVVFHGVGVLLALGLRTAADKGLLDWAPVLGGSGLLVLGVMVATALATAVDAFYTRGDLDLLLSSPLPPQRLMLVRALGIAVTVVLGMSVFLLPMVNSLAVMVSARWLLAYVTVPALALLATAIGLALALALFRLIGPSRTKLAGQILAGLLGFLVVLAGQIPNLMQQAKALPDWLTAPLDRLAGAKPLLAALGQVLTGQSAPVLLVPLLALALFVLIAWGLAPAFVRTLAGAAAVPATPRRRSAQGSRRLRPRGPRASLRIKEWRLMRRDPSMLAQQLLQNLGMLVPLSIILFTKPIPGTDGTLSLAWTGLVLLVPLLAGSLLWLTLSAEDAPELVGTLPVSATTVRWAKIEAALIPAFAPLLLVPLFVLPHSPRVALILLAYAGLAGLSASLLSLWYAKPGKRKDFAQRRKGSLTLGLGEMFLSLAWLGACTLALLKPLGGLIAAVVLVCVLAGVRALFTPLAPRTPG